MHIRLSARVRRHTRMYARNHNLAYNLADANATHTHTFIFYMRAHACARVVYVFGWLCVGHNYNKLAGRQCV